jgi:ankyrin repeat protein
VSLFLQSCDNSSLIPTNGEQSPTVQNTNKQAYNAQRPLETTGSNSSSTAEIEYKKLTITDLSAGQSSVQTALQRHDQPDERNNSMELRRRKKGKEKVEEEKEPMSSKPKSQSPGKIRKIEISKNLNKAADIKCVTSSLKKKDAIVLASSLRSAIEAGNINKVDELIKLGAPIATKYKDGLTPLHVAVQQRHIKIAALLIAQGANVNAEDKNGLNPLYRAVEKDQSELIALLEKAGAIYPLHEAIKSIDIDCIQMLIEAGAKVKLQDINGNTALHLAIRQVDLFLNKCSQSMLENYTIPDFKNIKRPSLMYLCMAAIKKDYIEATARPLIELGADINARNKNGETPLYIAVQTGSEEGIKLLSEQGADINIKDIYGNSPLHYAAGIGQLEIVKLLIKEWGDDVVKAKNNNNESALHCAAKGGHVQVVDLLIRHGAKTENRDKYGNSPLHCAAEAGELEVVKLLIEWGYNINAKNNNNESALHYAARKGHAEVSRFLIEKGININAQNKHGYNALVLAIENAHVTTIDLLKKQGANIDVSDEERRTPLHWAAYQSHTALIKRLKEQGANIDARDLNGCTPLHLASGRGQIEVIEVLKGQGADIDARDQDGYTAQQLINQRPTPSDIKFTYVTLIVFAFAFLVACMLRPVAVLFFPEITYILAVNYNLYRRYIRFYISARNIHILDRITGNRLVRWGNSLTAILCILMLLYTLITRYLG